MSQPARVVARNGVARLLDHVQSHRQPNRNHVIILLSFKAGLRACEIAGLDWTMVLEASGRMGQQLYVAGHIAKNGNARRIPLHPELRQALIRLRTEQGRPRNGPIVLSERGGHMTAHSIVNWFRRHYAQIGLDGCSSHSGRRTFITQSARLISKAGGSLRDIQELVGHRDLNTTQRYIEGDRDAQRKLIRFDLSVKGLAGREARKRVNYAHGAGGPHVNT